MSAPTPIGPNTQDTIEVKEIVRDILALRKLTTSTGTITTRSQNQILRSLDPKVLARVARILAEIEEAAQ